MLAVLVSTYKIIMMLIDQECRIGVHDSSSKGGVCNSHALTSFPASHLRLMDMLILE